MGYMPAITQVMQQEIRKQKKTYFDTSFVLSSMSLWKNHSITFLIIWESRASVDNF
jgi:hypothetical protein